MDGQDVVAIAAVATATFYLGWRLWRRLAGKRPDGCSRCADCASRYEAQIEATREQDANGDR